ncbi:MAG TPA: hypothetical protein VMM12_06890 [Longimicrobiales bacterium]|nr:hypothetical protein [Longimicrobiales bacterium]
MPASPEMRILRGLFALLFGLYFVAALRDILRYGVRRRFDRLPGLGPDRRIHDERGLAMLVSSTRGGTAAVALALGVVVLCTDIAVWIPGVAFPVIVLVAWLVMVVGSRAYISDDAPGP